jgi:hypothetical protein
VSHGRRAGSFGAASSRAAGADCCGIDGAAEAASVPAHDDHDPSLSITKIEGQALLWCFAGCTTSDVLAALDLGMSDLFDNRRNATYGYTDGRQVRRWYGDNAKKQFSQFGVRNTTAVLYGLEEVKAAVAASDPIYLCEGEKDCHAIEALGAVATTAPMGAANFDKVDVSPLYGNGRRPLTVTSCWSTRTVRRRKSMLSTVSPKHSP